MRELQRLRGDKKWPQAQARTRGFEKAFEEYSGLEIVKYWNEGGVMKKARDKMTQYLVAHGKPLIALGVNNTSEFRSYRSFESSRCLGALKPTLRACRCDGHWYHGPPSVTIMGLFLQFFKHFLKNSKTSGSSRYFET
ncbi:hypothetical protein AKJ40_01570 [candidate division MSBL1 archaeon SCGC-AAA259M10]|uniref:Uncharacterized protein n=1 Tax=candidate division MSBL1 archaeon SCGC-AAA259M10 TaxID=1698270 RepID=A0A133V1G5_9EURY|nr:hypothetical protein AKJ40_01570 [candidate division MSBL1 archaeon SCGC-AAA259M10]